jgi:hypothetical protein
MKHKLIILLFTFIAFSCYSQTEVSKESTSQSLSDINLELPKNGNRGGLENDLTAKRILTVTGDTEICTGYNTSIYEVNLEGANGSEYYQFKVWKGVITKINDITYDPPVSNVIFSLEYPTLSKYEITVDWNDNANGKGTIYAHAWWQFGNLEEMFYVTIGKPALPSPIILSNNNPVVGQTLSCTTEGSTDAYSYTWGATIPTIIGNGLNASYTPNAAGTSIVKVKANNTCGSSPYRTKTIIVNAYGPINVSISGPEFATNNGFYNWIGTVANGVELYDYHWYYSYDGLSYTNTWAHTTNSDQTTNTQHLAMAYDFNLYLKLVVTDGHGTQGTAYFFTENSTNIGHKSSELGDEEIGFSPDNIFPNPTTGKIFLPQIYSDKYTSIQLYSVDGSLLVEYKNIDNYIDISLLENGLYILKFNNSMESSSEAIKILKK